MQKAQEEVAIVDEALTKLRNSLASVEHEKQSNQCVVPRQDFLHLTYIVLMKFRIKFLSDPSSLPPPVKQTAASLKHQSNKGGALSFLRKDDHLSRHTSSTNSPMPSSPTTKPFRPPVYSKATPTSVPPVPQGRLQRIKAIRIPLIHLLAIRPLSAKFLAREVRCKEDEVLEALSKIGREARLDPSKFDLKDPSFKELDVWSWKYPDQRDRDLAIQRATSAFDRMRLSPRDPIFQKLLPKEDRGKGKTLSKLDHLNKGPIQQSSTPRIHVQHPDDFAKHSSGNDSDRRGHLAPSDTEPMAHSHSQGSTRKRKMGEKATQSKRLLSKGPKKVSATAKEKEAHAAVKRGSKKVVAPLSSEFVNDSDEEDGLEDSMTTQAQTSTPKANSSSETPTSTPPKGVTSKVTKPKAASSQGNATPSTSNTESKDSKESVLAHSNRAVKPKRSVPTPDNGKGLGPNGIRSREEGKVAQKAPEKKPEVPSKNSASKPKVSESGQRSMAVKKGPVRPRKDSSPHKPSPLGSSPPANASDIGDHELSSASSTPLISMKNKEVVTNGHVRNTSEHSLKRKAGDLDNNIHDHGSPLPNGHSHDLPNGHIKGPKRPRTGELTPPLSDSPSPPDLRNDKLVALDKAQKFKDNYYPTYQKLYREVEAQESPTPAQIGRLEKMHERLREMKEEIVKEFAKTTD